MANILVIDDDSDICKLVERALQKDGHIVTIKSNAINLTASDFKAFDLLLLDVMMPKINIFGASVGGRTEQADTNGRTDT